MNIPSDLSYTTDHEWVRFHATTDGTTSLEGTANKGTSTTVTVGITAYASDALGDVVFVELPALNSSVVINDRMGEVESTKSVSDLYAPVAGKVIAVNSALADTPGLVNSDPYDQGWLCEIEVAEGSSLDVLLDATAYQELTGE